MIDELLPQIEEIQKQGAVVLLKWDGERTSKRYTVVITHSKTDYIWRADSDDLAGSLRNALADYKSKHSR